MSKILKSIPKGSSDSTFKADENLCLDEVPPPPETLNETGQFWWNYYCGLFLETGNLSRLYVGSLSDACHLRQLINDIQQTVSTEGAISAVVVKVNGEDYLKQVTNPMVKDLAKLYQDFDKLAYSLGITPLSARVNNLDGGVPNMPQLTEPPPADLPSPETLPFKIG